MKFKGQNIIFNKIVSRMSLFQDMDLGEMGPNFQNTVYFFSGCCKNMHSIKANFNLGQNVANLISEENRQWSGQILFL